MITKMPQSDPLGSRVLSVARSRCGEWPTQHDDCEAERNLSKRVHRRYRPRFRKIQGVSLYIETFSFNIAALFKCAQSTVSGRVRLEQALDPAVFMIPCVAGSSFWEP